MHNKITLIESQLSTPVSNSYNEFFTFLNFFLLKGGVPLNWFNEISVFFAIRHDFVIFLDNSVKEDFFCLVDLYPTPPPWGPKKSKKSKKIKPWRVTYQMKGNDFSIRPFKVLDQLEVIWPHHDQKCDLI